MINNKREDIAILPLEWTPNLNREGKLQSFQPSFLSSRANKQSQQPIQIDHHNSKINKQNLMNNK